ncbi:DNA topoisomerase I, mitochondrial-like [Oppia nitens]|uniref:DNA topoisomerase I, mitochondrial-like n=1 Tax=Oppia nitens TaxID=1686743 RepID=UPI0023DB11E0|nr:DNA topoisomerase I, mitochondrial-like [Oppia nitens]XP_054164332.1 DNA topoisomerase I, mitochondrial-like [Oppia nitens]XP_054164333.1 DNA topoisomerase I, mitochondrial-like [Oppia nitens]
MPNSSSPEGSVKSEDNSYNSDSNINHNNINDNSDSEANNNSDSDSDGDKSSNNKLNSSNNKSGSDSDDENYNNNNNNNNNGNNYDSESQSQSQNDYSSQSIKRERSDSEAGDDSDDEPLSKKLTKHVKKEKSDSEDEYSPQEKKSKSSKSTAKVKKTKDTKGRKRKNDSDYESEYDSEEEEKYKPKKTKKKKSYSDDDDDDYKESKKKSKSSKNDKKSDSKSKKTVKKEINSSPEKSPKKRVKKEENEEHIWKWWEEESHGEGIKWKTLEHKGPVFPPDYEPLPKSVKFYYEGKAMRLKPPAEEVAGFYARMLEHDYVGKDVFNKNFFKDWRKTMNAEEKEVITDLKKCNFKELAEHFKTESERRKNKTKEEKQEIKKQNEKLIEEYGYCVVDGHKQKIGNFRIEPPGLFRGRGEHPKMGRLKKRVRPEEIIINIGKKANAPKPPEGHKWKEVRHDNTVTWLVSWTENIMGNVKYIMLNPSSKLKSQKDWMKYEKARELKKYINKIRDDYRCDFKAREMVKRQRAVALYFIDKLALRAGNEKEEGETADTVGCCSLRVEHIQLHKEKNGKEYVVDFDFLGKDSIRYENSVSVEKRVFKNLQHFMENKNDGDDLFDRIDTADLNRYLNSLMDGLTAKVFRTYNASQTLQTQLNELTKANMSVPEKILAYNRANRAVALLCNHQRAVPKTFDKQMENLEVKIKDKKKVVKEAKKAYKDAKKGSDSGTKAKLKKRLDTLEDQLQKLEVQRTDKEENKQIALGTSKLNYLDPRISVAWCKKYEVSIDKIYNKTQRDKFRWAIEMVGSEYQF